MSDVDAMFEEMTRDLDIDVSGEVIAYTTMTDVALSSLYADTRSELFSRGELLNPTTDRGKDLGAMYHGCVMELRKRHLL